MINLETESLAGERFTRRTRRTRLPSRRDQLRASRLAGLCPGDPLPPREAVYESLLNRYPCADE